MATNAHLPPDVDVPTGDEMYDAIMSLVEPDLMLARLPELSERFSRDTPDEKKKRQLRYLKAFMEYDLIFERLVADPLDRLTVYSHRVMHESDDQPSAPPSDHA